VIIETAATYRNRRSLKQKQPFAQAVVDAIDGFHLRDGVWPGTAAIKQPNSPQKKPAFDFTMEQYRNLGVIMLELST
jgi:hypothetical protein